MFNEIDYNLNHHLDIGRMGEYWVKFILTMLGMDVYTTEVDNKGIDFIIKKDNNYFDVQVKSIRGSKSQYVFITKENEWCEEKLRNNLILALVLFNNNQSPKVYLIPSTAWLTPDELLKNKNYKPEQKSKPEWGINLSSKNILLLDKYRIDKQLKEIFK
jgi:hypothetical protein